MDFTQNLKGMTNKRANQVKEQIFIQGQNENVADTTNKNSFITKLQKQNTQHKWEAVRYIQISKRTILWQPTPNVSDIQVK